MSNVVEITDLNISFATDAGAVNAVDGVSLTVARGEVLAIVGESGSGKTVTAKAILGLLPDTATEHCAVLSPRRTAAPRSTSSRCPRHNCARCAGPTSRWSSRSRPPR